MKNIWAYKKHIAIALLLVFVVMQLFRINTKNEPVVPAKDFIALSHPDHDVEMLLRTACYDCHSNETRYPWYSLVAPVSWWIKGHIDEGREELNFSMWADYTEKEKAKYLKKGAGMVKKGKMPLNSYTWIHADARLTDAQKAKLAAHFSNLKSQTAE